MILYGSEDGGQTYYVQTCCNQEHNGTQPCYCHNYGEFDSEIEAKTFAQVMSETLRLPIKRG